MTWEDDVLTSYEKHRESSDRKQWIASQRTTILENGHIHAWHTLRAVMSALCNDLNEKAGREIFKSTDPRANYLNILREDSGKLQAEYDPKIHIAKFQSDAFPFAERSYELVVRNTNGSDRIVWLSHDKKNIIDDPNDIAQAVIKTFLESGHS